MADKFNGTIRSTGKPIVIGKENIFMAFRRSDKFHLLKLGHEIDYAASEFATDFAKNFVFKEENSMQKISLLIKNHFHEWEEKVS